MFTPFYITLLLLIGVPTGILRFTLDCIDGILVRYENVDEKRKPKVRVTFWVILFLAIIAAIGFAINKYNDWDVTIEEHKERIKEIKNVSDIKVFYDKDKNLYKTFTCSKEDAYSSVEFLDRDILRYSCGWDNDIYYNITTNTEVDDIINVYGEMTAKNISLRES